jgi:hypothetical protein
MPGSPADRFCTHSTCAAPSHSTLVPCFLPASWPTTFWPGWEPFRVWCGKQVFLGQPHLRSGTSNLPSAVPTAVERFLNPVFPYVLSTTWYDSYSRDFCRWRQPMSRGIALRAPNCTVAPKGQVSYVQVINELSLVVWLCSTISDFFFDAYCWTCGIPGDACHFNRTVAALGTSKSLNTLTTSRVKPPSWSAATYRYGPVWTLLNARISYALRPTDSAFGCARL